MKFEDYRKTRSVNCFSKVDTLGSFDFYNYIISLDAVTPRDVLEASKCGGTLAQGSPLSVDQFHVLDKVYSLAIHEYTHFVDASSTLWGLRYLKLLDLGYQAYGNPDGVIRFPAAKALHDFGRSIAWPPYYTEKYGQGDPGNRPWRAQITGGRVFDTEGRPTERPIIFTQFSDKDGRRIVRSPISTVSILEASAMAQEFNFRMSGLAMLGDFERIIEMQDTNKKIFDYIYHPDLTEYSVCAHLFANHQQCQDVSIAYSCIGMLTRRVLNFPRVATPVVDAHIGAVLHEINGWSPASEPTELVRAAIARHDVGGLFYLLVLCLPPNSYSSQAALLMGIEAALARLGLDANEVKDWADEEAAQAAEDLEASPIQQTKELSAAGLLNYRAIPWDQAGLRMDALHLPQVALGDNVTLTHIFHNPQNVLHQYNVARSYEELYPRESWVHRFAQACF